MKQSLYIFVGSMLNFFACASHAHFQMLYTDEAALTEGAATNWALVFSHPFSNGYPMSMGTPREFYVVHDRGAEIPNKTTDLREYLKPVTWTNSDDQEAAAYTASLPKSVTRSIGDYSFVLTPEPYFEEEEDKYIQQVTKTVINVGGVPGAWDAPMGLSVEIVPLDKPYANWVGGVFRAVVLADGEPVPNAEIEIEYINHDPQIDKAMFDPTAKVTPPQTSFATMSIRANAQGEVMIGLPKAGWWGICALDLDDGLQHKGKDLSVDAVLWVRAYDIND
ncbi:MAG: DUF4198 domain-containing protein [Acidiferrobacterales bacterium]|nr:DUF4198 domain-containing protein [Acidiferrobacterales bacterium]